MIQSFTQPQPKTNRVIFLSDRRNLNKQLKRKLYPIPNINYILLKLEGFQYATPIDLDMYYYQIYITKDSSDLYMFHSLSHSWT